MAKSAAKDRRRIALPFLTIALLGALVTVSGVGCAYFNLFYNAKVAYSDAERMPKDKDGKISTNAKQRYDQAIEKCELLIATHPKSKWVDDAILMMGKAFYYQENYDEAITKFDELGHNFPDSDLSEEARFYLGKAYHDKGDHERAVTVLEDFIQRWPDSKRSAEVFYLVGTSLIKIGREDEAIDYLEIMAMMHKDSEFVADAYLEIAGQYMEREDYQKALPTYDELGKRPLNQRQRIARLAGMARAYLNMGRYDEALRTSSTLTNNFVMHPDGKAVQRILQGRALLGVDSIGAAVERFDAVQREFPKSKFAAEADFYLGVIYQDKLDSLEVAQKYFDEVPRQYSRSFYAPKAIERSSSISRLLKIEAAAAAGDDTGKALAKFNTAEIQYFQFNNVEKALETYRELIAEYPTCEYAPRAAYAIAYIYDTDLGDPAKAQEAYKLVVANYPDSQQAQYAREFLQKYVEQTEQSKRD